MDPPKLAECFAKMEHNLKLALEEDDRNQRENDAKLRAISQRTLTYEEFRYLPQIELGFEIKSCRF